MEDGRSEMGTMWKWQVKRGNKPQRSLRLSGKNQVDRRGAEGAEEWPRAERGPTEIGGKRNAGGGRRTVEQVPRRGRLKAMRGAAKILMGAGILVLAMWAYL